MVCRVALLIVLAVALAGCPDVPDTGGDNVSQTVVPPTLGQVSIEPVNLERSEVVRIALKNPSALPPTQIDEYTQSKGKVDILWLIDDSGAMEDNRTLLAGNFAAFYQQLATADVDFLMGVISTDGADHGTLRQPLIDRNTPDAGAVFAAELVYPSGRVAWVQAFDMMTLALTTANPDSGFPQFITGQVPAAAPAALGVIAVSNADDESFGGVPHFARFLRGVLGPGNENWTSFSTISGDLPSGCQPAADANVFGSYAAPSVRFTAMANASGGVVGSICDTSFQNSLTRIADALNTLRKAFPLSLLPDPSTITVEVNGASIAQSSSNGWTYVAATNSIQFLGSYVPPPGSQIQIEYAIAQ